MLVSGRVPYFDRYIIPVSFLFYLVSKPNESFARNLPFALLEKAASLSGDQLFESSSPQDSEWCQVVEHELLEDTMEEIRLTS